MMRLVIVLAALLSAIAPAIAEPDSACNVAAQHARTDFRLPQVARAIADKLLNIVVIGSASSSLIDSAGVKKAYPARVEAILTNKLPGVTVHVLTFARPRETAAEMDRALPQILSASKPALTIWQTGTVEAMRRVDIDDFRSTLDDGIDRIKAASSDVMLVNPQYSPRTELMMDAPQYAEAMRIVALQHEIPLFDRFSIMRHWGELGTFDLNEVTKKIDMAAKVHSCIGTLMAGMIVEGANLPAAPTQGNN
jgi:hypothetical protein